VHDRPVLRDVAHRGNGQSNHSFLSKAEQSCPKGKFLASLADETQKDESEQPFEALSWHVVAYGVSAWSRCALEGLFEALPRFLSVALYPAVAASERISFRQINKKIVVSLHTYLPRKD
jgi:hypothetical protein